jgi:hypothetical protein
VTTACRLCGVMGQCEREFSSTQERTPIPEGGLVGFGRHSKSCTVFTFSIVCRLLSVSAV